MGRIRPLAFDEAPPETRSYFEAEIARYGAPLNTTGVFAYSPEILRAAKGLSAAIVKAGGIDPQLRSLLCVRVATQIGCPF